MKSRAALLYGEGQEFRVEEIEVDDPKQNEVLVHLAATGLCHSDYHMVTGEYGPLHFPMIGGHEGAGVVEKVGPGVTRVSPGDHVLLTFIPACGHCRFCSMGLSFLCDRGAAILQGPQLDGTFRMHTADGQDAGQFCCISTFSEYTVVPEASIVPIDKDLDLTKVCIVGCCVPTGFGSAVNRADVQPGETVVIFGIGGVGINAVQERTGLLFSDGMQTTGSPAEPVAAAFPQLHVVATARSPESLARCRRLADLGRGRCAAAGSISEIPAAVNSCLAA